ncbi:hypothetical protein [Paenibacillus radicis (ex Gao et al. 2016)]|uniref:hypothetical protein n=1 Tax=Paenibacillus radicis (ex Gao et al. 2016) TaxID=1737354 RepID=UPI001E5BFA80|nr:hypothetical protein [Paenibacillus radicis (ex Gao et al. 2016)]
MVKLKFKAVFLDFYGTIVHEDEVYIEEICQRILESAVNQTTTKDIGKYWWQSFSRKFQSSYGENFKTQRQLELSSLEDTAAFYRSSVTPIELCEILYGHWQTAQLFDDAKLFLTKVKTRQSSYPILIGRTFRLQLNITDYHSRTLLQVRMSDHISQGLRCSREL